MSAKSKGFWRNPEVMGLRKQAVERALDNQSRSSLRQRGMLRQRSDGFAPDRSDAVGRDSAAMPDRLPRD